MEYHAYPCAAPDPTVHPILLYHVGQVGRPMEYHPYPSAAPDPTVRPMSVGIDTTSLYGHMSNTMTISHKTVSQPEVKKRKKERPCHEELER